MRVGLNIVVEPDDEGLHAYIPDLPGLHSAGQTEQEAVANAADAALAYLESMIAHGEPLPIGCATPRRPQLDDNIKASPEGHLFIEMGKT